MKSRGFSIVELVIVITIMGILMSLATVTFIGTKANARDSERKADLQAIALHLETYYRDNGSYPSTADLGSNPRQKLIDIDEKSLNGPELTALAQPLNYPADINTPTTQSPLFNGDQYVYQPLAYNSGNWEICTDRSTQSCRKFNLYAWLKASSGVYTITSKNQ